MLNLAFYKGKDLYSDGDIENEILHIVDENISFEKIIAKDNRWPILYHLDKDRRNILEWYPFKSKGSLLEIGAGCGAITGLFCEKLNKVVVVELSKRRANIIDKRYKFCKNLDIIVGNIGDINLDLKFDYITLIGVLEYTKSFFNGEDPYGEFLRKIKKFLKKDGKLIIAIENKFGLKYWAGSKEDHSGMYFDSIYGYIQNSEFETFSKQELTNIISSNGFIVEKFYYPYPDYKFPQEIFSDDYLPDINHSLANAPNYDLDRLQLFNEKKAYYNINRNKSFDFFSNSFLLFAGLGE